MLQTIIGLEAEKQMRLAGDWPDVVIGCVGGGSNFAGISFPFMRYRLQGQNIRFVAVEPRSCPSMSRGQYRYDGDTTKLTPLLKMYPWDTVSFRRGFTPVGCATMAWRPW